MFGKKLLKELKIVLYFSAKHLLLAFNGCSEERMLWLESNHCSSIPMNFEVLWCGLSEESHCPVSCFFDSPSFRADIIR